jgi:hypothetical protein
MLGEEGRRYQVHLITVEIGRAPTGRHYRASAAEWRATLAKKAAKRELIAPKGDKRFIRRRADGTIKESDDIGRSLSADRRQRAKTKASKGQGDRGGR